MIICGSKARMARFTLTWTISTNCTGLTMTNERFDTLVRWFATPVPSNCLSKRHMDLAASIQAALRGDRTPPDPAPRSAAETGLSDLAMAGGVALNCVANGKSAAGWKI